MNRMSALVQSVLLGLVITIPAAAQTGTEYRLYYLGGQSNMEGFGYNDQLSEQYARVSDRVMIYTGLSAPDEDPDGGVGRWARLQPGNGLGYHTDGTTVTHSERFGPELTFGHRLVALDPNARIAIVKFARGGSPLYVHAAGYGTWSPEVPGANQYDFALRAIHGSRAVLDIDGDGVRDRLTPAGIVWMQGEADAVDSAEAAAAYESNLRRMMDLFRAALGTDDLPVVIGQITDSGMADDGTVMDWATEVRGAQRRYTDSDECAVLVTDTNDFEYPPDDAWHYTTDGYERLGIAFADAIVELESRCPP